MWHLAYGRVALARRAWYERRPAAQRTLARPVISVGNLSVGGTGKTPLVAALARWLADHGERPVILSRGYARRVSHQAPLVVSDGTRVLVDVQQSGDEPQMLARALPGVAVVVGADRHQSGLLAESTLGATVHVLDDGFQHVRLRRDLDLVVTPAGELQTEHVLPKGRLREPLSVLSRASALVVVGANDATARAEAARYGVAHGFGATRRLGAPVAIDDAIPPTGARIIALSAIGRPTQFAAALSDAGWDVVGTRAFGDHHWFSAADLGAVTRDIASTGAWGALTTNKDAVRLEALRPLPFAAACVPLTLDVPRWAELTALVSAALVRRRASADVPEARA